MQDKGQADRRKVLKSIGAASATMTTISGLTGAVSASIQPFSDMKIFVEEGLQVGIQEEGETVGSPEEADMGIVHSDTSVSRMSLIDMLNSGAMLAFVGPKSDDGLLALLANESQSEVAKKAKSEGLSPNNSLDASFGMGLTDNDSAFVSAVVPHRTRKGMVLSTHEYLTDASSNTYVQNRLKKTLQLNSTSSVGTASTNIGTTSTSCPDAEDGWACMGRRHIEKDLDKYGQIERFVWGTHALCETVTSYDYFGFKVQQTVTPGVALGRSNWQTDYVERTADVTQSYDGYTYELVKHGPDTVSGQSSENFNVGVNVGVSEGKPNVGASLGYGWSTTYSHTDITETTNLTQEKATHNYDTKKGTDVSKNTFSAYPGYRVDSHDEAHKVEISIDEYWRFVKNNGLNFDDHHMYGHHGTEWWSANETKSC